MTVNRGEVPLMLGKTMELHCAAVSVPTPSITWLKDNKPLHLQTTDRINITDDGTLVIRDATPQDVGEYQCVGNNPAGTATGLVVLWSEGGLLNKPRHYSILGSHQLKT